MPKYTVAQDITRVLSPQQQRQLTDDNPEGDSVTKIPMINEYLSAAESFAESYVLAVYSVPVANPPPAFVHAILIIAKYHLLLRRGWIDDSLQTEYDRIMDWLEMIRNGEAVLAVEALTEAFDYGADDQIFNTNLFL